MTHTTSPAGGIPKTHRIAAWLREHPGRHMAREIADGLGLTSVQVFNGLRQIDAHQTLRDGLQRPERGFVSWDPAVNVPDYRTAATFTPAEPFLKISWYNDEPDSIGRLFAELVGTVVEINGDTVFVDGVEGNVLLLRGYDADLDALDSARVDRPFENVDSIVYF